MISTVILTKKRGNKTIPIVDVVSTELTECPGVEVISAYHNKYGSEASTIQRVVNSLPMKPSHCFIDMDKWHWNGERFVER